MANLTALNAALYSAYPLIELLKIDASKQIGEVFYFCDHVMPDGSFVKFNGIQYTNLGVLTDGFGQVAGGEEQRPTITVPDIGRAVSSILAGRSLVEATVTRFQVYQCHLDNGATPDASQYTQPASFIVKNMISGKWGKQITWQLMAPHDMTDRTTPLEKTTTDKFPGLRK